VQGKSPRKVFRATDADSLIGDNIYLSRFVRGETMLWIPAQIHFVMSSVDVERPGQLSDRNTTASHHRPRVGLSLN
jgi:hypothetical protein